jgi:hypothetical protein
MKGIFLRSTRSLSIAALAVLLQASSAYAAPFTPGNVVVVKVGNGTTALSASAAPVSLCEYTAAGSLVQTIALPTAATLPSRKFTLGGLNTAEGFLNVTIGHDTAGTSRWAGTTRQTERGERIAGTTVAANCARDRAGGYTRATSTRPRRSQTATAQVASPSVTSRTTGRGSGPPGRAAVAGLLRAGMRYTASLGATTSVLVTGTPNNQRVPADLRRAALYERELPEPELPRHWHGRHRAPDDDGAGVPQR